MNPFATHMPLLLACLRHTSGPVLELGSGWFSTPLVAAFATDRLVRTIETNPQWYDRVSQIATFQPITHHRHQIVYVPDYNDAPMDDHQWSVVLLDHEPPPRRGVDALRLKDRSQLIIGHDSEHPDCATGGRATRRLLPRQLRRQQLPIAGWLRRLELLGCPDHRRQRCLIGNRHEKPRDLFQRSIHPQIGKRRRCERQ